MQGQAGSASLGLRASSLSQGPVAAEVADERRVERDEDELSAIKASPGSVSLATVLSEIDKLQAVRQVGLPPGLFDGIAANVVAAWRARAAVESPSHLARHDQPIRLVLLAALLHLREREITDTLVQLLNSTVHKINAHADKKVTEEIVKEYKRVRYKNAMLHRIAEVSLARPHEQVEDVIYQTGSSDVGCTAASRVVARALAQRVRRSRARCEGCAAMASRSRPASASR